MFDQLLQDAILPSLFTVISAIVGSAVTALAVKVQTKTGITIQQQWRDALHRAIVTHVKAVVTEAVTTGKLPDVDLLLRRLRDVPDRVRSTNPEAVKHTKATTDAIVQIARAKLPEVLAEWRAALQDPVK